jgi:hypothetical protein
VNINKKQQPESSIRMQGKGHRGEHHQEDREAAIAAEEAVTVEQADRT